MCCGPRMRDAMAMGGESCVEGEEGNVESRMRERERMTVKESLVSGRRNARCTCMMRSTYGILHLLPEANNQDCSTAV